MEYFVGLCSLLIPFLIYCTITSTFRNHSIKLKKTFICRLMHRITLGLSSGLMNRDISIVSRYKLISPSLQLASSQTYLQYKMLCDFLYRKKGIATINFFTNFHFRFSMKIKNKIKKRIDQGLSAFTRAFYRSRTINKT